MERKLMAWSGKAMKRTMPKKPKQQNEPIGDPDERVRDD